MKHSATTLAMLLAGLLAPGGAAVARPAATVQERTVDMLALVGGERLFGMFAAKAADGEVKMLVRRAWLRTHAPDVYRRATAGEEDRRRTAIEQLRDRLAAWRGRRNDPKLLASFLD